VAYVVDASMVCAWIIEDEATVTTDAHLAAVGQAHAVAPSLLIYEVANALLSAHRRGRLSEVDYLRTLAMVKRLPVEIVSRPQDVLADSTLALTHGLSIYDASYLSLARDRGFKLMTLDARLLAAAKAEGLAYG
jgi:predicted nucleic acid-binding protein